MHGGRRGRDDTRDLVMKARQLVGLSSEERWDWACLMGAGELRTLVSLIRPHS